MAEGTLTMQAVEAMEGFFGTEIKRRKWTLDSGWELCVSSVRDTPAPGLHTHLALEAYRFVWKGVVEGVRLLPVLPVQAASDPDDDGALHVAMLLDWAIDKQVPPRPREIVLTLGHSEALPHIRFDYPHPWEMRGPAQIDVGGLAIVPVMAYSISDQEALFQQRNGADALEVLFEKAGTPVFDRNRTCTITSLKHG